MVTFYPFCEKRKIQIVSHNKIKVFNSTRHKIVFWARSFESVPDTFPTYSPILPIMIENSYTTVDPLACTWDIPIAKVDGLSRHNKPRQNYLLVTLAFGRENQTFVFFCFFFFSFFFFFFFEIVEKKRQLTDFEASISLITIYDLWFYW